MKRILLLSIIGLVSLPSFSQERVFKYWVELTDKKDSPYSIDRPEEYLSPRAIARRKKQNITIVENDLPVNRNYIELIESEGAQILHSSKWFNAVTIQTTDEKAIDRIKALAFVKHTKLLYNKIEVGGKRKVNTMLESFLEGMAPDLPETDSKYGFAFRQIEQLKGEQLHYADHRGEGMIIAVLDAGFYNMYRMETFDHLRKDGRLLGTWDFVDGDSLVYEDDMHGMNVLSCMAAYTEYEMIGTAPKASYWLIRTEDNWSENPIEEANWIAGAEMADSLGADLINSSLGYNTFDTKSMSHTHKDLNGKSLASRAATMCAHKGMIVCNAAGNEGSSKWKKIGIPADADSIVTVGGIDKNFVHSDFSSFGPTADGRIKPTVCAMATATTVASSKNKFYPSQGTSFASPVMCGMIACLWQANPTKTNMEIIQAVMQSSDNYNTPDNTYGYGVPNFELANRILGGDPEFDYSTSSWINGVPENYYDRVELEYYSAKEQTITITVITKGFFRKKKSSYSQNLKKGEFFYYTLNDLPRKRKGITIEVRLDGKTTSYFLNHQRP